MKAGREERGSERSEHRGSSGDEASEREARADLHRRRSPVAPIRWVYLLLGWVFFGTGVAGIVLPVVPATPFMLLALWGFSRSSPRLEAWLLAHRVFGASLRAWKAHRVIPLRAKLIAWGSMLASLAYMLLWSHPAWWIIVVAALLMAYGAYFIARCPSRPPAKAPEVDSSRDMPPA